jgi:hypothetical protein
MEPEAATYLTNSNPLLWARSAFPVPRFGSLNFWMETLRSGSHLNALVKWVSKVKSLFSQTETRTHDQS